MDLLAVQRLRRGAEEEVSLERYSVSSLISRTPLPARASKYSSNRKVAWPGGMLADDNIAPDADDDEAMLRLFGATRPRPPGTPDGGGIIAMVGSGQAYVESKQQQQECGDDVRARSMRRWQHRREAETDGVAGHVAHSLRSLTML